MRLLGYQNIANMGNYREALAVAAATGSVPNIVADDQPGRRKTGYGINVEQPLADQGESGVFARFGHNDGNNESFAFTEVDQLLSVGGQLAGVHWQRAEDRFGIAVLSDEALSPPHRDYLAAGGCGFLPCDGRLNYAHERIFETYYRSQYSGPTGQWPVRLQLSPTFSTSAIPASTRIAARCDSGRCACTSSIDPFPRSTTSVTVLVNRRAQSASDRPPKNPRRGPNCGAPTPTPVPLRIS